MSVLIYPEPPKKKGSRISNGKLANRLLALHLVQTKCDVLRVISAKIPQACFKIDS